MAVTLAYPYADQAPRLRSGLVWLAAAVVTAHIGGLTFPFDGSGWAPFAAIAAVAVAALGIGMTQLVLLAIAEPGRLGVTIGAGIAALAGVLATPLAGLISLLLSIVHVGMPVAAAAFGIALLARKSRAGAARPWFSVIGGLALGLTVLAIGVVDSLVLLPSQLAPGVTLNQLYAQLAAAGEDGGVWVPIVWASVWVLALGVLAAGLTRHRTNARTALGLMLTASVAALMALPAVQFALGMGIADTFATGGGMSAVYPAINVVAAGLAVSAAALLIGGATERQQAAHADPAD